MHVALFSFHYIITKSSLICILVNGIIVAFGTVSAKIAPRLKCYKNASRLNRFNFPTDNAIDFLHHFTMKC